MAPLRPRRRLYQREPRKPREYWDAQNPPWQAAPEESPPPTRRPNVRLRIVVLAVTFILAAIVLQFAATMVRGASIDEQVVEIAKGLKCPVCQNVPVAYSQAQLAAQMRDIIREKLEQGESKEAIIHYLVARYGEDILLEPPRRGFGLLVWLSAAGVLVFGMLVVALVLWNWTHTRAPAVLRPHSAEASPENAPAVPPLEELERLLEAEFQQFKRGKLP